MGDRLARVARSRSSRSLFGLGRVCSWGRMSLSSPGSASPSAPMTPGRGAPRRVGHPVRVEAGLRLGHDDPLGLPAGEQVGRHGVAVAPAGEIGLGQLDQDGVGLVARGQVHPLGRRDDVVGRGDDLGDGRHLGPVAQALERFETGHRATLAHRKTRPVAGSLPRLGAWTTTGLDRILTAPNVITMVRLLCIPIFLWLLFGRTGRRRRPSCSPCSAPRTGSTGSWPAATARSRRSARCSTRRPTACWSGTAVISIMIYGAVPLWFGIATIAREVLVSAMVVLLAVAGRGADRRAVGGQGGHIRVDVRLPDLPPRRRDRRLAGAHPGHRLGDGPGRPRAGVVGGGELRRPGPARAARGPGGAARSAV